MSHTRFSARLLAAAAALTVSSGAFALPSFSAGENNIFFRNFENLYRATANCTAATCLAATADDPAGFQRINSTLAGNVQIGDIFVGILDIQNVTSAISGTDTYNSTAGDRFTGYFAQAVNNITFGIGSNVKIDLGIVASDPFGILQAGEMYRLYSGVASFSSGGTVASGIATATSGTFWASLGFGTEGYQYSLTDFSVPATQSNTESFAALDFIVKGPGYNAGELVKINDFNEDIVGGLISNPAGLICSAAELVSASVACTDAVAQSFIDANNAFGRTSPWMFASNDPVTIVAIPEPTSLALVGLALAGLGATASRRRQKA